MERLAEARERGVPWRKWGPYLSERQWGTVREDYSENGDAWNYFSHDQARSRAYRWGEDGLAGFSDDQQHLCFALALWNGRDPILKERLFGLTNSEGNHGEDVKEYYFYLDSTPTHSYMKWLYKYPQAAYPYAIWSRRTTGVTVATLEYELLDTGVFDDDRYFDVFVEYAKADARGCLDPDHVLPTAARSRRRSTFCRLFGFATPGHGGLTEGPNRCSGRPQLAKVPRSVAASHTLLGERYLYCEGRAPLLFTENETNNQRLFGTPNAGPTSKTGSTTTSSRKAGCGQTRSGRNQSRGPLSGRCGCRGKPRIRLRLTDMAPAALRDPFDGFAEIMQASPARGGRVLSRPSRRASSSKDGADRHAAGAGRHAVEQAVLLLRRGQVARRARRGSACRRSRPMRNREWFHMVNDHVISMPDKWEYPWYAAWDLAFHTIALSTVDVDFAKQQLDLMLREFYLHPSGQIPAYEWNFGDVNPPVHAWATIFMYRMEQALRGQGDLGFPEALFGKLMLNFTWWVNRKDRFGKNVFEGGFLGLDNIGVFDRSAPLPTGGHLEQADGTAWMALFCQNMLEIGVELAAHDSDLRGHGHEVCSTTSCGSPAP